MASRLYPLFFSVIGVHWMYVGNLPMAKHGNRSAALQMWAWLSLAHGTAEPEYLGLLTVALWCHQQSL